MYLYNSLELDVIYQFENSCIKIMKYIAKMVTKPNGNNLFK